MAAPVITDVPPALSRDQSLRVGKPAGRKPLTMILVAAIALLVLSGLARSFQKAPVVESVRVVAAGKDIAPGCRLGFTCLHYLNIPRNYWSPQMVTSYPDVVGRVATAYIPAGEPIVTSRLLSAGKGLSPAVNVNERAITLKLADDALVDHSICPGDRVDVIATSTASNGKKYTRTICQNLLVLLSVPKEIVLSDKLRNAEQNKITLAAAPADTEKLAQATETGRLRLVLRNPLNWAQVALSGADERDLLPHDALRIEPPVSGQPLNSSLMPPPPPPPALPAAAAGKEAAALPPPPLQWIVEVFKGSHKESNAFSQ